MKSSYLIIVLLGLFLSGIPSLLQAEKIVYPDSWGKSGFTLSASSASEVEVTFSIKNFTLADRLINGTYRKVIQLSGTFLPNDEGLPDVPRLSRYIAIPQDAQVDLQVVDYRTEKYKNIDLAPAPHIPFDTEDGPLQYNENQQVYSQDAPYPAQPFIVSQPRQIRGVDVVLLGITPFQYNPVQKELTVYRDVKVKVTFSGGSGHFGEDRLRSRWWDTILNDMVLNRKALPHIDYSRFTSTQYADKTREVSNVEYLIIVPDDPVFIAWADSIKLWRNRQGISTGVVTTTDVGGNTFTAIESYVDNAYYNWETPPSAVLLLADYGSSGSTIMSSDDMPHPYSGTYVSDNYYADVDGDDLPDIVFSRITARDADELQNTVGKILNYERHPPTNPSFYDHPVSAMGWQTSRWFQLCSEIIAGFWEKKLGKSPVRENSLYSGGPEDGWSTAENTQTIIDYFGPDGLGYIPATPDYLTDWGGNATRINADINSGAFIVQHRDHGSETGWGEPSYSISDLDGLHNDDLPFVFSINCLTGEFNWSSECFVEAFHRYPQRALGLIGATQVSYSFVNDTYTWGMYDNLWPEFMPDEQDSFPSRFILPSFGNASGKYFLQGSDWPSNPDDKQITYYLFHHHGGSFSMVYSEVPQYLTVTHNSVLESGATTFGVTADEGSLIGLSVNGEIIGTGDGTGDLVEIPIAAQNPGDTMSVTVTKQNYYRYSSDVPVVSSSGPYVTVASDSVDDYSTGNANGLADFNESILLDVNAKNLGSEMAYSVNAVLATSDQYAHITDSTHSYGDIDTNQIVVGNDAFALDMINDAPDQHSVACTVTFTDKDSGEWVSNISIVIQAPVLATDSLAIDDSQSGNNNQKLDAGETADLLIPTINSGHSDAPNTSGTLTSLTDGVTVNTANYDLGTITAGDTVNAVFSVSADASIPLGTSAFLKYTAVCASYSVTDTFEVIVGDIPQYSMQDGVTETVSNALFFDSGGPDNDYGQRERLTMTFKAEDASTGLTVKFTDFDVASGDELHIYDGPTSSDPEIPGSPFSGATLPPLYNSTNPEGALTFYFSSNLVYQGAGWRAELSPTVVSGLEEKTEPLITHYNLYANYPNPFNPSTTIAFDLPEDGAVHLKIYDVQGKLVRTLVNHTLAQGAHRVLWDGRNNAGRQVTSGVYLYSIESGHFSAVRKMILLK